MDGVAGRACFSAGVAMSGCCRAAPINTVTTGDFFGSREVTTGVTYVLGKLGRFSHLAAGNTELYINVFLFWRIAAGKRRFVTSAATGLAMSNGRCRLPVVGNALKHPIVSITTLRRSNF